MRGCLSDLLKILVSLPLDQKVQDLIFLLPLCHIPFSPQSATFIA